MQPHYIASTKLAFFFLAAVFAMQVYQAAEEPIRGGEAYIYDRFVRPTTRQILAQELLNRDVLSSLLEKRSVGLFHVSPFSVRLPSLLFGLLYLRSLWQLARLLLGGGRGFLVATVAAGVIPLEWDCFSRANGVGGALALMLCAVWLVIQYLTCNQNVNPIKLNLSGACLGLSVAMRLDFVLPAAALGLVWLVIFARRKQWAVWTDRILVPAVVSALVILAVPLSHAHAVEEEFQELTAGQAAHLQAALAALQAAAGSDRIRIGAPTTEPIVNFYRAQHRVITWDRATRDLSAGPVDYYLLPASAAEPVARRHLIVLYRDADFLVARRSAASM